MSAGLQKGMPHQEVLMFEMDDINPQAQGHAEDRRVLSDAYAHWTQLRAADIKMTEEASAELTAVFDLLNRADDGDGEAANL